MRVVFNGSSTLKRRTGVGHYAAGLFDALQAVCRNEVIDFFPTGPTAWLLRRAYAFAQGQGGGGGRGPRQFARSMIPRDLLRRIGGATLGAAFRLSCAKRYDLYHEPNFIPFVGDLPTIATVHDLSVLLYPDWHPADRVRMHERQFFQSLRNCNHFIAVSEYVRREMIEKLGLAPERVHAVPNGLHRHVAELSSEQLAVARLRLGLPESYFLFVGTIEPRKNLGLLMRAYCALPAAIRRRCPLLLVGSWGWNVADVRAFYEAKAEQAGVRRLGYVADADLPILYQAARALVFPSHYEGFGFPLLEMMACGGAILSSTAGACREVLGPHGFLIDALDEEGWRNALAQAAIDDDFIKSLRVGVRERASLFTWESAAIRTLEVYRVTLGITNSVLVSRGLPSAEAQVHP